MPVVVIVGGQWGDEGKGKIVDLLSSSADIVARYQGGANAGHTVVCGERKRVLHLIPSGILHPNCTCVLGAGCVVDPEQLIKEIEELESEGVQVVGRLFVSHHAHLIMPYHKLLDEIYEQARGDQAIGVTGRGIGPAYTDKYTRVGIRIVDLLDKERFQEKLIHNIRMKRSLLENAGRFKELWEPEQIASYYLEFDRRIDPLVKDVSRYLNEAIEQGKRIICEGAQGTLLDVDWGTYPYVTSSHPSAGGAIIGLGFGPSLVNKVIGVIKAYTTRVGYGPFPTELPPSQQGVLRELGDEYGATTGRARRCGWFDAVVARHSARINGVDFWALTKLDVLSHIDPIPIAVAYRWKGELLTDFPAEDRAWSECQPVYEEVPGWKRDISEVRVWDDLPNEAKGYIRRIEELTHKPVGIVSVGSRREQTILMREWDDIFSR